MSWSYTALTCWEKCAAQYNFRFNLRIKDTSTGAARRGSEHHEHVERYIKGELVPLMPSLQPAFLLLDRLKTEKVSAERKIALNDKWEPTEWEGAWHRCVIDAIEEPKDESLHVWEWKTGRRWPEHEDQRSLYGLAGLSVYPEVSKAQVNGYYLDDHTMDVTVVERDTAEPIKKDFEDRVYIMQSDATFAPRPGVYCRWCSYAKSKGGPCKFS